MARRGGCRVGNGIIVRRRGARDLARFEVAVGFVSIDHSLSGTIHETAVISTVIGVGTIAAAGSALPLVGRSEQKKHLVQAPGPSFKGHDFLDLILKICVADALVPLVNSLDGS